MALVGPASAGFDEGEAPGELAAPLLADHANIRAALEGAIEAASLLKDHLDVTVMITRPENVAPPRATAVRIR